MRKFFGKISFEFNYLIVPGLLMAILGAYAIFGPVEAWHGGVNRQGGIVLWEMLCGADILSLILMFSVRTDNDSHGKEVVFNEG